MIDDWWLGQVEHISIVEHCGSPEVRMCSKWCLYGVLSAITNKQSDTQSWICFQFLVNHSGACAVSSQSSTCETDYTQKLHFYAVSWHKQPPDNQPIQFDLNCQCNLESYDRHHFFGTKFRRGFEFFLSTVGGFFNKRENSGADWLDLLICTN